MIAQLYEVRDNKFIDILGSDGIAYVDGRLSKKAQARKLKNMVDRSYTLRGRAVGFSIHHSVKDIKPNSQPTTLFSSFST